MMKAVEAQLSFDYTALDTETRAFVQERAEAIHRLARMTAAGIVQIGQNLIEVRDRLKEQKDQERLGFLIWIVREFGWQKSSAYNFMNVAERIKLPTVGTLEIDCRALYLIAAPSTPEPVRQEVIKLAIDGTHVRHEAVKAVVAEFNKTGDIDAAVGQLARAVAAARKDDMVLPSPAEARRRAIASGAHTLDRNGIYQPPMTHEDQAEYRADMEKTNPPFEFCRWVAKDGITPEQAAQIIAQRDWERYYKNVDGAVKWLAEFQEQIRRTASIADSSLGRIASRSR